MPLLLLGVNYQSATIAQREKISFPAEGLQDLLRRYVATTDAQEVAVLSTCNRTEIYTVCQDISTPSQWVCDLFRIRPEELDAIDYQLTDGGVARHAFRVASGLDSMVLGEAQILGQMKKAVQIAGLAGTLGGTLHKLFQLTFRVAKDVRSRTQVGASSVSMAGASVKLAEQIFPSISDQNILFVGAGEMIDLCSAHFCAKGPKTVYFANRTLGRAENLAVRYGGRALTLVDIPGVLAEVDIVVSCTASPLPIIGKGTVESAIKKRKHRPIFMVDLAVPRDVEQAVGGMDDVFLYTVDDLVKIVDAGETAREAAAEEAENLVNIWTKEFGRWLAFRESVPVIKSLRAQAEAMRSAELKKAVGRLQHGVDPNVVVEELSRALTNKLIHGPCSILHEIEDGERTGVESLLKRAFQLEEH